MDKHADTPAQTLCRLQDTVGQVGMSGVQIGGALRQVPTQHCAQPARQRPGDGQLAHIGLRRPLHRRLPARQPRPQIGRGPRHRAIQPLRQRAHACAVK